MTTKMKKYTKRLLGAVCVLAILATGCEYPDGSAGLWNVVSLAIAALSGYGLYKLEGAR